MHFRAFEKPKHKATKFIDSIWFGLFMMDVYIVRFIVSTKKGEQPDNPNSAGFSRAQRTYISADQMVLCT